MSVAKNVAKLVAKMRESISQARASAMGRARSGFAALLPLVQVSTVAL